MIGDGKALVMVMVDGEALLMVDGEARVMCSGKLQMNCAYVVSREKIVRQCYMYP